MKISIRGLLRTWWARWLVLPVLLLLGAHAVLTLALMWRFEARLSELRAAGEPVELQDLAPPPVPEAENGAALLLEAERVYDEQLDDSPMALTTEPADWEPDYRTELLEWLAKGDHYRKLLAEVAAKPALRMDLNWDAGTSMEVPAIRAMQSATLFLDHRALYGEGGTSESMGDIEVMLGLASKLEHPTTSATLVRWAIESIASTAVIELAGRPGFDASAARSALDRSFDAAVASERRLMRTALRGERALGIDAAGRWISGESPVVLLNEIDAGAEPEREKEKRKPDFADVVFGSWLFRPIAYGDALRLLNSMNAHLSGVDLPAREAHARSGSLAKEYTSQFPWVVSSLFASLPVELHRERVRHLARMRIARAGLALLELRQKRGEWPPTLEDVVALVGADTILDPFTGDRLAYEPGVRLEAAAPVPDPDLREEYEIVWRFREPAPVATEPPEDDAKSETPVVRRALPHTPIRSEDTLEELRQKTNAEPADDVKALLAGAEKAFRGGEPARAIKLLEEAAQHAPSLAPLPTYLHDLAVAHLAAGDRNEGKRFLKQALAAGRPPDLERQPPAPPPNGISDAMWKEAAQAFEDDFRKESRRFKSRAIEMLPIEDARAIDFIINARKLLGHENWWIRTLAAERLSKVRDPALRAQLHSFATDPATRVREGVVAALAMSHDPSDTPVILAALADPAWEVRRMACWAAGQQRVREAVEPMLDMIHQVEDGSGEVVQKGESDRRVHSVLLFNLEEITGKYFHTDALRWMLYWFHNRDKPLPPVKHFEVGDFAGVPLQFNDTLARNGSGPLIVALPETHKTAVYYMPYCNQWTFVKWLFVNLPPIHSFPDAQYNSHGDPIYPVDILVDAFESMRKERGVEKMILLGHGFSSWIAAKYAEKYPDRVQGLVFIETFASSATFSKCIDRAKQSADPDTKFWGQVSSYEIKIGSRVEGELYTYVRDTAALAPKNRGDLEIGMLRRIWRDPAGSSISIPEFDIRSEAPSRIPCLMYFADESNELTGHDDLERLKRYYRSHVVGLGGDKFARLPFMEAPEEFEKALREFLRLVER